MDDRDRVEQLLSDIRRLSVDADRIVGRGREAFFDPTDRTQRLAAKAIIIDLNTAVERLPDSYRDARPEVPWRELRIMRNYLAHDYANTDYQMLWNVVERELRALIEQLSGD